MQNKWTTAATSGFLLALITIIITLVQTVFTPGTVINIALWLVKTVGSIWLLYYFLKEHSRLSDSFTYGDGFRYGTMVAFFSSLICACYMFLHYAVIFPDMVAEQMSVAMEMMASSNPDSVDVLEKIEGILPHLVLGVTLVYYTIIGMIASAIMANYTKTATPFMEQENENI